MIGLSSLAKAYGQQTLFEDVSLQLNPGNRYGLVGANGSGKSTLLRILAGQETASGGQVSIPKRARLGVLEQDQFRYQEDSLLAVVMMGHRELWEAMLAKEELLARADEGFDAECYARLEDVVLQHDGYSLEARAGEILEGLGLPSEQHTNPMATLSGGFKLRVLLAQVLASDPDVLLLDEPTNHLDIVSIRWLEKFLVDFQGCAVVISHDHRFLDNVCSHILDIDYQTVSLYRGNYREFEKAKQAERQRKEAEIAKREREIADHKAFIDRFRAKATKARQAQSKVKQMQRIVIEPLPQSSRRYPTFRFRQCRPSGRLPLRIDAVCKRYGDHQVLDRVSLQAKRGERIAIIGPNGIGKSTLLKIVMGIVPADSGVVEWGYEAHPGYFPQDHRELLGDARGTVESWLWDSCPGEPVGFVRSRLGLVLFSEDEVKKRMTSLSGGEAARLIFCRLAIEAPNVLVLDEPTNHLDLEAIEALVSALKAYDGTLLLVSHDRWFVSQLATRIVEISALGVEDFAGTYEEYLDHCGDDHLDVTQVLLRARREKRQARARRTDRHDAPRRKRVIQQLSKRRDQITAELERAEDRIHAINELFCNPGFFERAPRSEVAQLEAEQQQLSDRVEALMREWERVETELEEAQSLPTLDAGIP